MKLRSFDLLQSQFPISWRALLDRTTSGVSRWRATDVICETSTRTTDFGEKSSTARDVPSDVVKEISSTEFEVTVRILMIRTWESLTLRSNSRFNDKAATRASYRTEYGTRPMSTVAMTMMRPGITDRNRPNDENENKHAQARDQCS